MPPLPAAIVLDRDPGAPAQLALGDLGLCVLADLVFAAGPVVGRYFCVRRSPGLVLVSTFLIHWPQGEASGEIARNGTDVKGEPAVC